MAKNAQAKTWALTPFSGRRYSTNTAPGGGPGEETVGPWSALDLSSQKVYRISDDAPIPQWTSEGGTVTVMSEGGQSFRRITPVVAGAPPATGEGNVGIGQLMITSQGLSVRKFNMRWEQRFGPDYITQAGVRMMKWAIIFASNTANGSPNGERPMLYLSDMDTQAGEAPAALRRNDLFAFGVASGTVKNFEQLQSGFEGYNWPRGNESFYFGPTATTIAGKRVVPQGDWYTCEMEVIGDNVANWPGTPVPPVGSCLIRLVIWTAAGEQLTDLYIPWNWDASWSAGNDFIIGVDVMGGGYMPAVSSPTANCYTDVRAVTLAANRPGLILPRS